MYHFTVLCEFIFSFDVFKIMYTLCVIACIKTHGSESRGQGKYIYERAIIKTRLPVGGGGGWEAGGGLHRPTGLFGVAMSPRSASHYRPRHDWRALRDVSPTQG